MIKQYWKKDKMKRFSGLDMWLNESIDKNVLPVLGEIIFVNLYSITLSLKTKLYSVVSAEICGLVSGKPLTLWKKMKCCCRFFNRSLYFPM